MHQAPDVLNYRTGHRGPEVKPGMCLAIEPMLVRGGLETKVLDDDWTVVTVDGARASQWEHSVAVHHGRHLGAHRATTGERRALPRSAWSRPRSFLACARAARGAAGPGESVGNLTKRLTPMISL